MVFQLPDRAADAPDLRMRRLHGCETAVEPDLSPCSDGGSLFSGPVRCELCDRHTGKLESPSGSVPAFLKTVKKKQMIYRRFCGDLFCRAAGLFYKRERAVREWRRPG